MSQNPAYKQLLTLINARAQQWLRHQIELMPLKPAPGDPAIGDLAEIAVIANICSALRGSEAPLQSFLRSRLTPEFVATFVDHLHGDADEARGLALFRFLPGDVVPIGLPKGSLADRLALSDPPGADLLAEAEGLLQRPVSADRLSDEMVDSYARVLTLSYRFGAERPRFSRARSYGDAFANCLRFAEWAQRQGRTVPLAQMCFCLCLIDPDYDVATMLAELIASQRPDGSFPVRLGFGTANQDAAALRPTLSALAALHIAVHRRWNAPRPTLPMAA